MIFFGEINNKKVKLNNPAKFREYVNLLEGKIIQLEIKKKRKIRSLSQNSLYWVWLGIISDSTGYYTEELHSSFKAMFLTDRTQKIPLVRSTTALNSAQFTQYLDKIDNQARDLGITLPSPDDYYKEQWKD